MKTILILAVASLLAVPAMAQGQPGPDNWEPQLSTNPPPKGFATRLDYIKSFTNKESIVDAYHAGNINGNEAILALSMDRVGPNDKDSMDTYGKVVDQDGQPVVDAKVRGRLRFEGPGDSEKHDTITDKDGRFHFLGLHGKKLGIFPEKEGYEFNMNINYAVHRPDDYLPDPKNPLIIRMWKLHGGEPMNHVQIHSSVPCDDSIERFNLLARRWNGTNPDGLPMNGDLMIKLTRNPLILANTNRWKPFNWSVTLVITNGGLLEFTNQPYPYEAPAEGYQPMITLDFPTNMVEWKHEFKRAYYFKAQNGQIYGRMTLHVDASRPQPPTYFDAEIYANPGGSRNLEFDPGKQIRDFHQ